MGLVKFRYYFYGKVVCFYTDHQALEPLIKRNRAYRQNSERLTRWLDRLADFDISIKYTARKNLKLTDDSNRNPIEEPSTEDSYEKECVINIFSELFPLNHKYGNH